MLAKQPGRGPGKEWARSYQAPNHLVSCTSTLAGNLVNQGQLGIGVSELPRAPHLSHQGQLGSVQPCWAETDFSFAAVLIQCSPRELGLRLAQIKR